MFEMVKRCTILFQKKDRWDLFLLALGIFLNSFMEILGIGLVVPFISLLAHPELLETNVYLHQVYAMFAFTSFLHFMIILAVAIIIVFMAKNALLLSIAFQQNRFVFNKQADLCTRLLKSYLMSPYSFHLSRNLGQFQQKLRTVEDVMQRGFISILTMVTEGLLVICLLAVLVKMSFILSLAAMTVLSGGLVLYFYFLKGRLTQWGQGINYHFALMCQQVNQGLGSIKESKLSGKESYFVNHYYQHAKQWATYQNKSDIAIKSPRLFIETTVVVVVMASIMAFLLAGQSPASVFTTISVFAIVTVRLMPSLNRISSSWAVAKYFMPSFNAIYEDLVSCERLESQATERTTGMPLTFHQDIRLEQVSFYYENMKTPAIKDVSLCIPKNSVVGFIGTTGAGKTTIIDIILGLLEPSSGKVLVDGADIYTHLKSWQASIGYIPQNIYLCDDTIRNNVAFGLEPNDINDEKVWHSLKLAQLDEFITSLPQGLETTVGERGVRLSGGQKQRIGIARALYHDPQVLVMDEATAALDNETERLFMKALFGLSKEKTIIIIAHRLTTVEKCEKIFFFKEGQLISEGKYGELTDVCPEFRKMAGVGHF